MKHHYPLPLVSSTTEHREAKYLTNVDLCSAYNLIHIREGDDWKLSASLCQHLTLHVPGHAVWLINVISVLQSLINEVLQEILYHHLHKHHPDLLLDQKREHKEMYMQCTWEMYTACTSPMYMQCYKRS